jgi:hypothetical protein
MLIVPRTVAGLATIKPRVRALLPGVPSSHVSESLAAAAGFRTHAALQAADGGPDDVALSDDRMSARLAELDHSASWPGFAMIEREMLAASPFKSARARAWRNVMSAAVNAGLRRGLFSLDPKGPHWPGHAETPPSERASVEFEAELLGGAPGRVYVADAGWDELSLHVVLWPRRATTSIRDGFVQSAPRGEVDAAGWLERRKGAWLQTDLGRTGARDRRSAGMLAIRSHRRDQVASATVAPMGFADHGKFFM